jgi:plastocyanin
MQARIFGALIAAAVLAACGSSTTTNGGNPPAGINGCTTFTDATAAGASRTVTFTYPSYSPPCLAVAAGQSVTFSGDFTAHPLEAGVAPGAGGTGSADNPIPSTSTGSSLTVAFPTAGTYPYFCVRHASLGMYGAIRVM